MLLEKKIYSVEEIASWFGITKETLNNSRKKKLELLSAHCDWEQPKKGQYLIKKVYVAEFQSKILGTKVKVAEVLPHYIQPLDTCINIGTKINREVFRNKFKSSYISSLVGQIIKENPDKYSFTPTIGIKKGENGRATFRFFSKEEEKLYHDALQEYVHELSDEKVDLMLADVKKRESGEISDNDFRKIDYNLFSSFDFMAFRRKVQEKFMLADEQYANKLRDFDDKTSDEEIKFL